VSTAPKLSSARPISVERLLMRYIMSGKRPNTVVDYSGRGIILVIPIRLLFRVDSKTEQKCPKTVVHMIFTSGIIPKVVR
jgi:hypothetical protein